VGIVLLQADPKSYFPAQQYTDGLNDLRMKYMGSGRLGTYFMAGTNITAHQHLFRNRFYEAAAGGKTIAAWVTEFLAGTMTQVGP
jgi:hypothetical protein